MSNANGIISGSVRQIADVKTVLGESVNTLSGLCKSTKINMWAKYKPVQFTGTRSTTWWKGRLLDCGIEPYKLSSRTSVADIVNHCDGTNNGWTYYARPNGSTYPYRLLDFKGYNHNATPPISSFRLGASTIAPGTTLSAFIVVRYSSNSDMLSLSDIDVLAPCYLGIYCRRTGTTTGFEGYCSTTIANGGDEVQLSTTGWTAGTYTIYPFLSTASRAGVAADFYTIPMVSAPTLTVVSSAVFVNISDATKSGIRNVSVTVQIVNRTSSSVTLKNNSWRTRPKYEEENDPETVEDMSGTIANQTVAVGATVEITFTATLTGDAADPTFGAMIYVYFQAATYKAAREII